MSKHGLSKVVWKISLPVIFVEATETLDHLIDSLFVSRVGLMQLGAIGVADAMLSLFLIAPLALVDGIQILTARRIGQRRPEAVGALFSQGLLLVLILGVVSTLTLKLFSSLLTPLFVESDAVTAAVDSYLQLDAFSIPLAGIAFAFSALLISLGDTRALVPATILLVIVDITLNYLFIFGAFGFPQLGMTGAAVGSIGAELVAAVYLAIHVKRKFDWKYSVLRFRTFAPRVTRLLSFVSAPIAAQGLLLDVRWFAFFVIIEHVGTEALAIANIVFTCYIVFLIPTEGFSETACSMVSRFVGENRPHRIAQVVRSATGNAILATAPFILLAVLAPHWLAAAFSPDGSVVGQSTASLRVLAIAMLIAIPAEMWFTAVVGSGATATALGIEFLSTIAMLGTTWLAAIYLDWPIAVVWLSVAFSWLVCLALSRGWMRSGAWRQQQL